jgi:non-heme chloroperoxidase
MLKRMMVVLAVVVLFVGGAEGEQVALKSGLTVHYVVAGPKGAPALVLLHGLGDTKRSWSLMMPDLAKTHRVYALDQRGHGGASAPECCYALADMAFDVVAFMDAMKIERAAVAGHSMGSFIAQHLASHYPERVSRLILIGSGDTLAGSEIVEWLWEQVRTADRQVSAAFIDEWQSNPTPVEESFLRQVKAETAAVPPHVWRGVARTLMTDQRRFLRDIQAPVLILAGEKDSAFPLPFQERLQQALPRATFRMYPAVGHNLHWEIPARVAADMRAFLGETTQGR